jgi:dihydrofolate reductase
MKISIVVAVAENGVIGKDNQLAWRLSEDLKRFKHITTGHFMLMGRKTFESIGKPLPNRTSLIVSRNFTCDVENCLVFPNIIDAINYAIQQKQEEIFVIGGGEIFAQILPVTDVIHLTIVHSEIEGDVYFEYEDEHWLVKHREFIPKDAKNEYDTTYLILEKVEEINEQ